LPAKAPFVTSYFRTDPSFAIAEQGAVEELNAVLALLEHGNKG